MPTNVSQPYMDAFDGQSVNRTHVLQDRDVLELRT